MSSCNTFPTLTRTDEIVTGTLSSSTTTRVTTLPPTTTTFTIFSSCTATATPCSARPIVTTSLIPGGSTTIVDTVTFTVPVTSSQLTTLWGTSCTPTGQDTTDPQTPTDTFTQPTSTPSPTFFTPPPSVIVTASSSTQADGSVTPVVLTITSTAPPVLVSETASTDSRGSGNSDSSKNLGPIIGGVVGGIGGLALILFIVWFILRRRRRWDDIFDNEDDDVATVAAAARQKEKQVDSNPKPYQYGLVGHTKSASLTSTPSSPPPTTMTIPSEGAFEQTHHRHSSNAPLLGLPGSVVTPSTSPSPRPPSSTASMQGYGPFPYDASTYAPGFTTNSAHPPQGQSAWDPALLYNPAMMQQPPPPPPPPNSIAGVVSATTPAIAAATTPARRVSHDVDNRPDSPVSLQERRILQVTNGGPDYGPQSPEAGMFTSPATASSDPQRDGKGRAITSGGKAPLVHLDGGRYQLAAGGSSTAGPAPPAYSE